ncbi:MAG TPA: hypothetical protein VM694_15655, partial [Polyangium sp.]|nr:hypothetical protein [Polyangium sp.]
MNVLILTHQNDAPPFIERVADEIRGRGAEPVRRLGAHRARHHHLELAVVLHERLRAQQLHDGALRAARQKGVRLRRI